jgi:DNA-directed RNA polymerase specialized sigma24 family protein
MEPIAAMAAEAHTGEPIEPLLEPLDLSRAADLTFLYKEHGTEIAAALRAALEALDNRQRLGLRYCMVDAWSIDKIGEQHEMPRATTVRWLTSSRDALSNHLRREIAGRLPIPLEEMYAIVREVRSRIDISFLRIM